MTSRVLNSLWKLIKTTVVTAIGTNAVLQPGMIKLPEVVDTWEKIGVSIVIGLVTGLLHGLTRFATYKQSLDPFAIKR